MSHGTHEFGTNVLVLDNRIIQCEGSDSGAFNPLEQIFYICTERYVK